MADTTCGIVKKVALAYTQVGATVVLIEHKANFLVSIYDEIVDLNAQNSKVYWGGFAASYASLNYLSEILNGCVAEFADQYIGY